MSNTIIEQTDIKEEIKKLENISIIAMENLETELNKYSEEIHSEALSIELLSLHSDRPLNLDIKKVY